MGAKQKIDRKTRVEYLARINAIIEALALRNFTSYEFRVMLAVLRKTYLWNKDEDAIGRSQFVNVTHISDWNIRKVLAKLIKDKVLYKNGKKPCRGGQANIYGLNSPSKWDRKAVSLEIRLNSESRIPQDHESRIPGDRKVVSQEIQTKKEQTNIQSKSKGKYKGSPSGEVAPLGSSKQPMQKGESDEYLAALERSENAMPPEVREILEQDKRDDFEKFLIVESKRNNEWTFANDEPLPDREYFHKQTMLIFKQNKYPEKVRRLVEGLSYEKREEFWFRVREHISRDLGDSIYLDTNSNGNNACPSDPEWGPPGSPQDNVYPNIERVAEQLRDKMNENSMMGLGAAILDDARDNLKMLCDLCDVDPEEILRMVDELNERDWEGIFNWECFQDAVLYHWDKAKPARSIEIPNLFGF